MMLLVRYMYIKTNALVLACLYFGSKTILKGDMLHYSRTVVKRTLRDSYTIHIRYQGFSVLYLVPAMFCGFALFSFLSLNAVIPSLCQLICFG